MLEEQLGQRIVDLCRERTLTQVQLAKMAGYLVEFISVLECGSAGPSIAGLEKFAKALKVDAPELFTFATKT